MAVGTLLAACGGASAPPVSPTPVDPPPTSTTAVSTPAETAQATTTATGSKKEGRWKVVDTNPEPGEGKAFDKELNQLYRVLACGTFEPAPAPFDEKVITEHCEQLRPLMQYYRDNYLSKAGPFFAKVRPAELPPTVVYPFGGGDLLSALTVYPDAREITTISLEYAGDPRLASKNVDKKQLAAGLKLMTEAMSTLLRGNWNWTRNMEATQRAEIPEQLGYALVAMVVHKHEPISMRYFRLRRNGSIDYLDESEIQDLEDKQVKKLRPWGAPEWSKAYSNVEIRFRKRDTDELKIYRHMAANLADTHLTRDRDHLTKDPSLLAHLEAKGRIASLTRAASHLLWFDSFSEIRNYLATHLEWMPSDSTGLPPPIAREAGLVQEAYGTFEAAYEPSDQGSRSRYNDDFKKLFDQGPRRELNFRFGYHDNFKNDHLIITSRPR